MAFLQLVAALFSLSRPRTATPPPDQVAAQLAESNSRLDADHDDEHSSSCSIGCALCSELGYKRPNKRSRLREDVAQWVRAFTAEFAPSPPSKPLSHLSAPRRRPQSNHIPFTVAIAEHQKPEDDEPAPPSTAAASPAWTWYSFPPYPEEDDDDDSDSATSAEDDCVTSDSQSTDSVSSATGSSGAPARKKVAAASTHSRQSSESGSSIVSWFPLSWLPRASSPKARTVYDRTRNPLSSVYARPEPSTLVSAVRPCAFPSRVTVEVPNSAFFDDTWDWPMRYPLAVSYRRYPLRWDKMALVERRAPRYYQVALLD